MRTQHVGDDSRFVDTRKTEHAAVRLQLVELAREAQPRRDRHQDVDDGHIDRELLRELDRFRCTADFRGNFEVGLASDRNGETFPKQRVVIDQHDLRFARSFSAHSTVSHVIA
jgi:hypothetical protein